MLSSASDATRSCLRRSFEPKLTSSWGTLPNHIPRNVEIFHEGVSPEKVKSIMKNEKIKLLPAMEGNMAAWMDVTKSKDASERWIADKSCLASLKQHLDERIQAGQLSKHAELGELRMKKDEEHVKRVASGLKIWVPDMWKKEQDLVNISGRTVASEEMVKSLLHARTAGEDAQSEFLTGFTEGANNDGQTKTLKYNDPIKKTKSFHIFTNQKENRKKKQTIPEDECESLGNILAQFDEKNLDLKIFYIGRLPANHRRYVLKLTKKDLPTSHCLEIIYNFSLQYPARQQYHLIYHVV